MSVKVITEINPIISINSYTNKNYYVFNIINQHIYLLLSE